MNHWLMIHRMNQHLFRTVHFYYVGSLKSVWSLTLSKLTKSDKTGQCQDCPTLDMSDKISRQPWTSLTPAWRSELPCFKLPTSISVSVFNVRRLTSDENDGNIGHRLTFAVASFEKCLYLSAVFSSETAGRLSASTSQFHVRQVCFLCLASTSPKL